MTQTVAEITEALHALMAADSFFPDRDAIQVDAPEPDAWRDSADGLAAGLADAAAIQQPEKLDLTRDAGPEDVCEVSGDWVLAYVVKGADRKARQRRRGLAIAKIAALVAGDRTLGLDASTYAELSPDTERRDTQAVAGATAMSIALVTVRVDFLALSAAG